MIYANRMVGLKAARETVESAASKVTASAETIAKSIGVAIGMAVGAVLIACLAVIVALKARHA